MARNYILKFHNFSVILAFFFQIPWFFHIDLGNAFFIFQVFHDFPDRWEPCTLKEFCAILFGHICVRFHGVMVFVQVSRKYNTVLLGRPSKKFKTLEPFQKLTFKKLDTFRKKTKKELGRDRDLILFLFSFWKCLHYQRLRKVISAHVQRMH